MIQVELHFIIRAGIGTRPALCFRAGESLRGGPRGGGTEAGSDAKSVFASRFARSSGLGHRLKPA